jgi:hypothetical protein
VSTVAVVYKGGPMDGQTRVIPRDDLKYEIPIPIFDPPIPGPVGVKPIRRGWDIYRLDRVSGELVYGYVGQQIDNPPATTSQSDSQQPETPNPDSNSQPPNPDPGIPAPHIMQDATGAIIARPAVLEVEDTTEEESPTPEAETEPNPQPLTPNPIPDPKTIFDPSQDLIPPPAPEPLTPTPQSGPPGDSPTPSPRGSKPKAQT